MPASLRHIAIIMDGNGRWAESKGLARSDGHRAGVDKVNEIVRFVAKQKDISHLTLYAFSHENWSRPQAEITTLMELLKTFLIRELPTMTDNNIRLTTIGDTAKLPMLAKKGLKHAIDKTKNHTGLQLCLALSYGGRNELVRAIQKMSPQEIEALDEKQLSGFLDTADMPDPDLIIRTSGEMRVSNFMLWQSAYSEFAFTQTLWPDFTTDELASMIDQFGRRERRFGGIKL